MDLKDLKKEYGALAKKHKLPGFSELNNVFEIEKIERESESLLRVVRKVMMERIVNSLGFLEMLINPVNAPRMYHPFFKSVSAEDKKNVDKIYLELSGLILYSLELEFDYSEKNEAEIIKKIYGSWEKVRKPFKVLLGRIKNPGSEVGKKEKGYFG